MTDYRRVVAEIGACGGDLALAVDTAQAAIEAGAWLVKGQMYTADRLVTRTAPGYGQGITEPATQHEAFTGALSYDEWGEVAAAVPGRFFASVFDLEACHDYPYGFVKVASADITYRGLVEAAAATGAKVIMSTGASTVEEINRALSWIPDIRPTLLVCTLCYPTSPADANVRRIKTLQLSWPDTGYSDHTRGIQAASLAFDYGAVMVEKHFTIRPGTGGDDDFAIGPEDLARLVTNTTPISEAVRAVYSGTSTLGVLSCEADARRLARRSIHAAVDIPAGSQIRRDQLVVIRPADGLEPWLLDATRGQIGADGSPVGKLAATDIPAGSPVTAASFGSTRFTLTVE